MTHDGGSGKNRREGGTEGEGRRGRRRHYAGEDDVRSGSGSGRGSGSGIGGGVEVGVVVRVTQAISEKKEQPRTYIYCWMMCRLSLFDVPFCP